MNLLLANLAALSLTGSLACATQPPVFADSQQDLRADGLWRVERSGFQKGWALAGVSFADYDAIWPRYRGLSYRHPTRSRSPRAALGSASYTFPEDLEAAFSRALQEIVAEEMTQRGRWRVAKGPNTIDIIFSLVDVIVRAPLTAPGGDDLIWIDTVAQVTIAIELVDSQTGTVLAHFAERQNVRPVSPRAMRATPGATKYEMHRLFRGWARALRSFIAAWQA